MKTPIIIFFGILAVVVNGCSRESAVMSSESGVQEVNFSLRPADGETSVSLDSGVSLSFGTAVDRLVVERGFHLISERAMTDSTCPVSPTMGHGDMSGAMSDSTKMHHLDRYHSTAGRYTWDDDGKTCTFIPDSAMAPGTRYMVHLGGEMTEMMDQRLGNMGMMAGHGIGMMAGEMMYHFFTSDSSSAGSGRASGDLRNEKDHRVRQY